MRQEDLKMWIEAHDCFVYKEQEKEDGVYYLMRSNQNRKLMAMLFPPKAGVYRPATVCHICNQLAVEVPTFGQVMQETVNEAKANCPKDWRDEKNKN